MVNLFKDTPRLRHLSIHGHFFSYHTLHRKSAFPLSNLTTVVLEETLDAEDWCSLIQSCHRIRYGDFLFDMDYFGPSGPTDLVRLADLEVLLLEARNTGNHSLVAQLANLEIPNLHTLRLGADYKAQLMSPEAFGFQHFHCLQSLILTCGWLDGFDGMVQLFQRTVNLKELALTFDSTNYNVSSPLFKAMTYAESHIILPKLASLRIHTSWGHRCNDFYPNVLGDMVKSRSVSESPMGCERLQSLTIALDLPPRDESEANEALRVVLLCSTAGVTFKLTNSFSDWDKERSDRRAFRGMFDDQ